jgi:spore coat polysaccharide biosynthesis protein SpsF
MLSRQLERIRRARLIDDIVVATSDRPEDDPISQLAEAEGARVYRGSLDDVLDRFYRAALPLRPDHVVRLTADCPLADWDVIDRLIEFRAAGGFDYASNALRPTWPDGLDAEVVTFGALETAWREATLPVEREHVMPFITRRPERFRLGSLEADRDLSAMRWTVDEPRDYAFVSQVYGRLYPSNPAFTTQDVLDLLTAEPGLADMNAGIERNEGLRKSEEAATTRKQSVD